MTLAWDLDPGGGAPPMVDPNPTGVAGPSEAADATVAPETPARFGSPVPLEPLVATASDGGDDAAHRTARRASRHRRRWIVVGVVVALVAASGVVARVLVPTTDQRFVTELRAQALASDFPSEDAAIAAGRSFCAGLESGKPVEGYKSQLVAVRFFCPQFEAGFTVVPTPKEQEVDYTSKLRAAGLGGEFASDAAAVAHAQSVCSALDAGGKQEGPEADAIAVGVYCAKYAPGFKTLRPIEVTGTLTLIDTTSYYFSSISAYGGTCMGTGGYSDMSPGQASSSATGPVTCWPRPSWARAPAPRRAAPSPSVSP